MDLVGARVLLRSGLLKPARPDQLLGMALAVARWGITPATGYAAGAARHPRRPAIIDDQGVLTWREVDRRTDRMASALRERGLREGVVVGLLARNGRGFVESAVALAKCGADVIYLHTGTSPSQLADVLRREQAAAVLVDEALEPTLPELPGVLRLTPEQLAACADRSGGGAPPKPSHASRQVILTSGTTGAPRGAARSGASIDDAVAMLSRIPLRAGGTTVIAAPVFHAWGLGNLSLAMLLGSAVVLQSTFDAKRVLQAVQDHQATALVVVPVLLERLLEADPTLYDRSALTVIASSGSALGGDLPQRVEAAFGPVLYSLYGSTEVAYAAVAGPDDLRADPRTAGRPPHGVTLRVVDDAGQDARPGVVGRIFVGSGLAFTGYTDGSDKDRLGALVATGDLGMHDTDGRLTVLGRTDDMVVIGGENVYVGRVEDALREHHGVLDVSVVGVPDPVFGSKLVAYVVASAPIEVEQLKDLVRSRLSRIAAPREVIFVSDLPRNAAGKVVKRELR